MRRVDASSPGYTQDRFYIHCDGALFGMMMPFIKEVRVSKQAGWMAGWVGWLAGFVVLQEDGGREGRREGSSVQEGCVCDALQQPFQQRQAVARTL